MELYPKLGVFYEQITGDEDARVCKDIPESACRHLPRNFFAYLVSNFLSKVADELASARLVLPWLLGAAGAPAAQANGNVAVLSSATRAPQASASEAPGRGGPGQGRGGGGEIPPFMAQRIKEASPEELERIKERMRQFGMSDERIEEVVKKVRGTDGDDS